MSEEKQAEKETDKKATTPLRTVTEFSGLTIRQASDAKTKLVGEGVAAEQLGEKLGEAISVTGDRLARLIEAVEAVGDRAPRVRLVRVFGGEAEPRGGVKVGEHFFVVDLQPDAGGGGRRDARGGGRGERGGGRGGRGGGGGGGGDRGRGGGGGGGDRGGFGSSAFGPPKQKAPRGLGSLVKAERSGGGGGSREEREERGGPMPLAGAGWMVTKDPSARDDRGRGGGKFDKKRGKGPRRGPGGPGGDRERGRGPGGPGGERRAGGPGGGGPGGGERGRGPGAPGGDANRGPGGPPRGPRPPRPHGPQQAPGQQAQGPQAPGRPGAPGVAGANPNQPGGPDALKKKRRRGGRGRGRKPGMPGEPGTPNLSGQPGAAQAQQTLPQQAGTPAPAVPVTGPQPPATPTMTPPAARAAVSDENKGNVKPSEAPTEVDGNR